MFELYLLLKMQLLIFYDTVGQHRMVDKGSVFGNEGDSGLAGGFDKLQVTECFGFQPDGSYSMRHLSVGYAEPLRAELAAFISAVRSGDPPAVTGEEGVASLEIAIRCLSSRNAQSSSAQSSAAERKGPRRVVG